MTEGKKDNQRGKGRVVKLAGRSEGRATAKGRLTVDTFPEYLVNRRVGIGSREAQELQDYADKLRARQDFSEADAWSLITSVEEWAQARKAFKIAIVALVVSAVIGACSLVAAICSLLVTVLSSA